MDSLKFAFDTLIVGALALPWLWLFMRIFFQHDKSEEEIKFPIIGALSESTRQAVAGVLILALGYVLGSAVSRISSDFFDDNEILHRMATQSSIRRGVYLHEYCDEHSVLVATKLPAALLDLPGGQAAFCKKDGDQLEQLVVEFFSLQEGKLLLEGEEKLGRLREFHDQIEILRGAALNGAILFILSWFGLCALYRARLPAGRLRIPLLFASYAPAIVCLLLGVWQMKQHFAHLHEPSRIMVADAPTPNPFEGHRDPPLAEAVMILLGIGGLSLHLTDDNPRLFRNVCLMAGVLTLVTYGSWWWTEVLYDQQVIHSFPTNIESIP